MAHINTVLSKSNNSEYLIPNKSFECQMDSINSWQQGHESMTNK